MLLSFIPYIQQMFKRVVLLSIYTVTCLLLVACNGGLAPAATPTFTPEEKRGQTLFEAHCARCHSAGTDTVIVGPSLAGIATRGAERVPGMDAHAYLIESILEPDAYVVEGFHDNQMPENFGDQLTEEELEALVAYLLTLGN